MTGTRRRPLVQRDAFARLVGVEVLAEPWIADHEARLGAQEARLVALEKKGGR